MADKAADSLSYAGQTNAQHLRQKRARSQLSCIPCRNGKLKCNRIHEPACDQCIKRNREDACAWAPPPAKGKNTQNVKGRIRQLECLVVDLMNQQKGNGKTIRHEDNDSTESRAVAEPTPPSSDEYDSLPRREDLECAKPFGQMRISKNEISYVGETHWKAILSGIEGLRRELEDEEEVTHEDDSSPGSTSWRLDSSTPGLVDHSQSPGGLDFMLGSSTRMTREQLLAAVPEKRIADRLLSLWFNSPDPFKPILHAPTFQAEYRSFLRDPSQTPTMWLGLLFALLSLAASFSLRDADPSSPAGQKIAADVSKYRNLATSAAVLADFTKPKQHTIECILLYTASLRSSSTFVDVWLSIGLCVRLALRMGYHRDSAKYPAISVFHGEMRRRVWAVISMMDVLISFQLALPSMVKSVLADTQPPRNLLDRDFDLNSKELPPSRSIDELTPSSYLRAKLRIVCVFAEAAELSHATTPPSHDEMMELDRRLEEAKAQLPPLLRMPDISELITDPAEQLMCRFNLDLIYHKTKIVIHRRYMETPFSHLLPQEQKMGIGMSRRMAVDSASSMLRHHHTIYAASQPGGQLESVKGFMGSITTNDFLLAAMIICLELSQQISPDSVVNQGQCPLRQAFMDTLERSQQIWETTGHERRQSRLQAQQTSPVEGSALDETEKAAIAMRVMLTKVKQRFPEQLLAEPMAEQIGLTNEPLYGAVGTLPSDGSGVTRMGDNALLGSVGTSDMNGQFFALDNEALSLVDSISNNLPDRLDYLGDMLDTSGAIDWNTFDNGNRDPYQEPQSTSQPDIMAEMMSIPMTDNGSGLGGGAYPVDWMSFQDMNDVSVGAGTDYVFNGVPWQGDGLSEQ